MGIDWSWAEASGFLEGASAGRLAAFWAFVLVLV
jgi:hypothetical protein